MNHHRPAEHTSEQQVRLSKLRKCDIVMEGGITSGIVYPPLACELSKAHRFKNIGGTSVGAIAAALTAAAEYRRIATGDPAGFDTLANVPEMLGSTGASGRTVLLELFQPQRATRRIFDLFIAILPTGAKSTWADIALRVVRFYWGMVRIGPVAALIGLVAGAAILLVAHDVENALLRWIGFLSGLVVAVVAVTLNTVAWLFWKLYRIVPRNNYGLCSGFTGDITADHDSLGGSPSGWGARLAALAGAASPAPDGAKPDGAKPESAKPNGEQLTSWLARIIDDLAGLDAGRPLTFGDLWGADPAADEDESRREINLEMMTSGITHGRPYRVTKLRRDLFFNVNQMLEYFPVWVVEWMAERSSSRTIVAKIDDGTLSAFERMCREQYAEGFLLLPATRDLPVVFGARMSMSFPGLLSAMPLWGVDWPEKTRRRSFGIDAEALDSIAGATESASGADERGAEDDLEDFEDAWERYIAPAQAEDISSVPDLRQCWFSDGGLTSNFPIHFFDRPLPTWPTFGVTLGQRTSNDAPPVWMPMTNNSSIAEAWGTMQRRASLANFIGALLKTMRTWQDTTQMRVPGYRDRIVHIDLNTLDGGLNLMMSSEQIERMARYGTEAGRLLAEWYAAAAGPGGAVCWENHRWVRYRSTMEMVEKLLMQFATSYENPEPGDRPYDDVIGVPGKNDPLPSYRWSGAQRAAALRHTRDLLTLASAWRTPRTPFGARSPRPEPELRIRPKM